MDLPVVDISLLYAQVSVAGLLQPGGQHAFTAVPV
jgi:hypothetical protein